MKTTNIRQGLTQQIEDNKDLLENQKSAQSKELQNLENRDLQQEAEGANRFSLFKSSTWRGREGKIKETFENLKTARQEEVDRATTQLEQTTKLFGPFRDLCKTLSETEDQPVDDLNINEVDLSLQQRQTVLDHIAVVERALKAADGAVDFPTDQLEVLKHNAEHDVQLLSGQQETLLEEVRSRESKKAQQKKLSGALQEIEQEMAMERKAQERAKEKAKEQIHPAIKKGKFQKRYIAPQEEKKAPEPRRRMPPIVADPEKPVVVDGNIGVIEQRRDTGDAAKTFKPLTLATLTKGEPFSDWTTKHIKEITGHPITRAGLTKVYQSILPELHAYVTNAQVQAGDLNYTVQWFDNDGTKVGSLNRRMGRDKDGSVELYSHGCWVNESCRNRAITARVMAQEVGMLKTISKHERTRLSLWAGGMRDPDNPDDKQLIGKYVWANFGYDFVSRRSSLARGGANVARSDFDKEGFKRFSDLDLMIDHFGRWIDRCVLEGKLPNQPETMHAIKNAARRFETPWDVASFFIPGYQVEVQIGTRKVKCDLGKAFMLSSLAPRWEGVHYVNEKGASAGIAAEYCKRSVSGADQKKKEKIEAWEAALEKGGKQQLEAIEGLGLVGQKTHIEQLEKAAKADPKIQEAVDLAVDRLKKKRLGDGFLEQAGSNDLSVTERVEALSRFLDTRSGAQVNVLAGLYKSAQTPDDWEVAKHGMEVLAKRAPDKPKMLHDEAVAMYERSLTSAQAAEKLPRTEEGRWTRETQDLLYDMDLARRKAVDVIANSGDQRSYDTLLDFLHREYDIDVVAHALPVFATVAGDELEVVAKEAIKLYRRGRASRRENHRETALKVLLECPNQIGLAIEIARDDPHSHPRRVLQDELVEAPNANASVIIEMAAREVMEPNLDLLREALERIDTHEAREVLAVVKRKLADFERKREEQRRR